MLKSLSSMKLPLSRPSLFDTHKFITSLTHSGFTEQQSTQLSSLLSTLLHSTQPAQTFTSTLDYTNRLHSLRLALMELRTRLESDHRNDMLETRLATDRIGREIAGMLQKARDSANSIRAESQLEVGIERGRLRDGMGRSRIRFHELKNGIDVEASNAQAALVKLRNDIFYSLIGFFFTSAAAFLGYLRYCN